MRVTPDTNVLVEAAISRSGPAGEILARWIAGEMVLVTCEEIVGEFEEVMHQPRILGRYARITATTIAASGAALRQYSAFVTLTHIPRVIPQDPDDDAVLACAVAGDADYIISRDRHLLGLRMYEGIPIITAPVLLRAFRGEVREESPTFVSSGAVL